MARAIPAVGSVALASRAWSILDFVLIWLGGLLGASALLILGTFIGDESWTVLLGLGGQYVGNLGVFWLISRTKDAHPIGFRVEGGDFGYVALGLVLQILIAVLFLPLSNLLFPDGRPQQITDIIADARSLPLVTGLVLATVLLAPVTEELMFRGVLLTAFEPRGRRFAVVMTAVVFSGVHVLGLDIDRLWQSAVVVLPPLVILGVILAWLTHRSGRLGPAILLHSGWNLLAAVVLLLPSEVLEQVG